jgi:hypothetical protein
MSTGGSGVGGSAGVSGSTSSGGTSGGTSGASGSGGTSSGGASGGTSGAAGSGNAGTGGQGTTLANPWLKFNSCDVVSRSNVTLLHANPSPTQLMPIGNGSLGAAVWAAGGFTAQLNRADTMPDRKSPGWLTVPGLSKITSAGDFKGTLDLCNGMITESGAGMSAKIFVRADADELVVDVTGADPNSNQTATVAADWGTRNPTAAASGAIGTLSETWTDTGTSASNQKFGSLAALTAGGRNAKAAANGKAVTVSFQPNTDGSFRVICGAPKFDGSTAAAAVASTLLGTDATRPALGDSHTAWWHSFWDRVGLAKITTTDGSGEYFEALRTIFLYAHASERGVDRPGSQAGVADFYNFSQDNADWFPAGYWFWNLRMQVAASMSSGAPELNGPLFSLYTSNLSNIQAWTQQRMGGRAGICVPETMRFNGNGYWNDGNRSCDQGNSPNWNALTMTTGAEISLWMWREYLMTQDKTVLQQRFPFMLEAARFLHTYATTGSDGKLQLTPSNAHEQQWGVTTSMNDVAAMRTLFPALVAAGQVVGSTDALLSAIQGDIAKLPELPRTNAQRSLSTTPSADATNIFANSYQPTAMLRNVENDDLEPVWPYDLVSDSDTTLFQVAQRTYTARIYKDQNDWSNDAITAARLGLANELPARLSAIIGKYQAYGCGLVTFDANTMHEPYIEQAGVLTTAINEAMATDFDGTIRFAPALPAAWTVSGTVYVQAKSKVRVQFANGALAFGVLEAGSSGMFKLKNPWTGTQVTVLDDSGVQVVAPTNAATLNVNAQAGRAYLLKRAADPTPTAIQVTGTAATAVKSMGTRRIGIE